MNVKVLFLWVVCPGKRRRVPDEQRLMAKLLSDYEPASRPVFNASHAVIVKFGLTLTQISDMVSEYVNNNLGQTFNLEE